MASKVNTATTGRLLGTRVLLTRLEAIKHGLTNDEAVTGALTAGALRVRNEAARLAPIKTGTLRRSITVQKSETSRRAVEYGSNLVYAATQEFGDPSRNIPARNYLRGALAAKRGEAVGVARAEFKKLLDISKRGAR